MVWVCQRKTKDRADGMKEKSAHCPRRDVCVCVFQRSCFVPIERFSKLNFGSIRRFRTMTGLEIENWIEKRDRTVRKFRSTRPRTESNFRFGLTSCRSQNLPPEVRSLLCQVFHSFSLVISSSSHHASHLRGFFRSLTRSNWSFSSTWLTMSFFTSAGDFRQVHGHNQWMNGQEVLAMGSPVIEDFAEGVPRTRTVWQRTLLWNTRTAILYSARDTRAAALGMQSYGRSYFCLLNVIFGCVPTEISIKFSTRSFPNRIEYSVC